MIAVAKTTASPADSDARFIVALPHIERYAGAAFRHLSINEREDAVASVVALAFKAYRRLEEQGRACEVRPSSLAHYAVLGTKAGRRLGSRFSSQDVLSRRARMRHGFELLLGADLGDGEIREWHEALQDNTLTPIPDQAAFRIDFPRWLGTLSRRNRQLAEDLAAGHRPNDVASRFKLTAGRVSQLRRELAAAWRQFHGEADEIDAIAAASALG